jgi:hypothetical protein
MNKEAMLKDFAKRAGVRIVKVSAADWGGSIGYIEKGYPNYTTCGFRTENAAYTHWLQSTFGRFAAKAVLDLMRCVDSRNLTRDDIGQR